MNLYQQAIAELQAAANRFGGIHQAPALMVPMIAYHTVSITVDQIEVTLHPRGLDGRDVHFDRAVVLSADDTQRAYEILAERHLDELEAIATALAKGELV